jgi:hypothetical protein
MKSKKKNILYISPEDIKRSEIGNTLLKEIFKQIIPSNIEKQIYFSPEDSYTIYDALINYLKEGSMISTDLYEVKVRDEDYPTLLLEKKKYTDLLKHSRRMYNIRHIYYVVITPGGSWSYDLLKLPKLKWITEQHNIKSTDTHYGKTTKEVTYLDKNIGTFIDIKTGDYEKLIESKIESKVVKKQIGFEII